MSYPEVYEHFNIAEELQSDKGLELAAKRYAAIDFTIAVIGQLQGEPTRVLETTYDCIKHLAKLPRMHPKVDLNNDTGLAVIRSQLYDHLYEAKLAVYRMATAARLKQMPDMVANQSVVMFR